MAELSHYLKFMKTADNVEQWLAAKENEVAKTSLNKGLKHVQSAIAKNEDLIRTLDELGDLQTLFDLQFKVVESGHWLRNTALERYKVISERWAELHEASDELQLRLEHALERYLLDPILVRFAKKANGLYTWFEKIKLSLTQPCGTTADKLKKVTKLSIKLEKSSDKIGETMEQLRTLETGIRAMNITRNPYTSLTVSAVEKSRKDVSRELERFRMKLDKEIMAQQEDPMRLRWRPSLGIRVFF